MTLCSFSSSIAAVDLQAKLPERLSLIKAGNKNVVLLGSKAEINKKAANFKVVDSNFKTVTLADFKGKTLLISVVPSIDTGTCSLQTKRFNNEVAGLPQQVVLLTISTDLPFAQKRFCQQEQVEEMAVLSDAVWRDFGTNYGLLIKDMGILARAVLIIDNKGTLVYQQLVKNLATEPDYTDALNALNSVIEKNK
ncbi:lipid hydroperoxide peroxidase [Rheinheimera salexigens]|uniref:Lipid hydroperoxide peroxidase n=1 Tax=Rheinheimera salexigens TaxID=1628148 RepID=A0A1E7QAI7_9GAMM|nr:lipid hydroperoxide peroxidase [Rheinheimera salexigens]